MAYRLAGLCRLLLWAMTVEIFLYYSPDANPSLVNRIEKRFVPAIGA